MTLGVGPDVDCENGDGEIESVGDIPAVLLVFVRLDSTKLMLNVTERENEVGSVLSLIADEESEESTRIGAAGEGDPDAGTAREPQPTHRTNELGIDSHRFPQ